MYGCYRRTYRRCSVSRPHAPPTSRAVDSFLRQHKLESEPSGLEWSMRKTSESGINLFPYQRLHFQLFFPNAFNQQHATSFLCGINSCLLNGEFNFSTARVLRGGGPVFNAIYYWFIVSFFAVVMSIMNLLFRGVVCLFNPLSRASKLCFVDYKFLFLGAISQHRCNLLGWTFLVPKLKLLIDQVEATTLISFKVSTDRSLIAYVPIDRCSNTGIRSRT